MNTADRSVEALDTALRRRFNFREMIPDHALLSPEKLFINFLYEHSDLAWEDPDWIRAEKNFFILFNAEYLSPLSKTEFMSFVDQNYVSEATIRSYILFNGLDLGLLLRRLNERIEALLDKDHQIGHAYFINVRSIKDLQVVMSNKIIPLLQEFFYGDYGKIGLVIGEEFLEFKPVNRGLFSTFFKYDLDQIGFKDSYHLKNVLNMAEPEFLTAMENLSGVSAPLIVND